MAEKSDVQETGDKIPSSARSILLPGWVMGIGFVLIGLKLYMSPSLLPAIAGGAMIALGIVLATAAPMVHHMHCTRPSDT